MTITPVFFTSEDTPVESDSVDHRLIGERLRPPASAAVIAKSVAAGMAAGLTAELAETLAHSAASQQQLRSALRSPKTQRVGTEQFTYVEFDVLAWRIVPSPDNIRFEGDQAHAHAHGTARMPRFGAVNGQPLLTFEMASSRDLVSAISPQIANMLRDNPHVSSIQARGIEMPGWLSFLRLSTELGPVTVLESTDGFGRTVAAHQGLNITFTDSAWNLRPGSRAAGRLHRSVADWATSDTATPDQQRKVRCSIMPNARVIIGFSGSQEFDRARRRFVAHLHMAPPMSFSIATTLSAKSSAAVDKLYENKQLPIPAGMTRDLVRDILDGTDMQHDLRADEVAVLACMALNPDHRKPQARMVNEAIADLTGTKPAPEDRILLAAEVALRRFPVDKRLTALRAALERAWRWHALRGVALTRRDPLDLLSEAIRELVTFADKGGPATAELAVLASYHLVSASPDQLLVRSEYGGRYGNTEPQQILTNLARSDNGLRLLCQVVLDGRAGRAPQELPDGDHPQDSYISDAPILTSDRLRQIALLPDNHGITHEGPETKFARKVREFRSCTERLNDATQAVMAVTGHDDVPLVDTQGVDEPEVKEMLDRISDHVAEWRGASRRASRMQSDVVKPDADSPDLDQ